ncbi:MAG: hypothetical protein Q7S06_03030 [Nanoarchaeota archaeon]|nr:hypothetical protein [Nanoarchaeota archaeon]
MPIQDPLAVKEKIFSFINIKGPSIPVRVAKEAGLSMLFASAFLSELLSETRIKISHMKVGGSPIYFVPGQENLLENFSQYLGNKEKEVFAILKEKRFLFDLEQLPSVRVALREMKDFAVPFKRGEEIIWRYFLVPESELPAIEVLIEKKEVEELPIVKEEIIKEKPVIEPLAEIKEVISEALENSIKARPKKKEKRKASKKNDEKFFEKVKDFLSSKSFEIINIESFGKGELVLRVKENRNEFILVALNKKRLTEIDIIKSHKRASSVGLKYRILMLGELNKNIENFINASKELEKIEKLE